MQYVQDFDETFPVGIKLSGDSRYGLGPKGRHSEGANFQMADGHVKWLQGTQVSPGWKNPDPSNGGSVTCNNAQYCVAAGPDASTMTSNNQPFAVTFSP